MTTCTRVKVSGSIEVALALRQAFFLFTPNGERTWAEHWTPVFPSGMTDDTEPGLVFETEHSGRHSIWTIVRCEPASSIGYSTTTPGHRAGTVTVSCQASNGGTTVTVNYDLTALVPEANAELSHFEAHFFEFLDNWRHSIARAIG